MKRFWAKISLFLPTFFLWVITIFLVIYLSIQFLPWQPSFPYYGDISGYGRFIATFAHFDGIHYLRLIEHGYRDVGSQAFFPVYPLLIRVLTFGYFDPLLTSIVINSILVVGSLYLVSLMLPRSAFTRFVLLFLAFPTSFYLIFNYTESLFIFLLLLFFHLLSKKSYLASALVAGIASGTRLVGVFLAISLVIDMIKNKKSIFSIIGMFTISLTGLMSYMYYLNLKFGDPLMFVHVQTMFGAGRSGGDIVLLPQVIYRYIKIFFTVSPFSLLYLRAAWEFILFGLSIIVLYLYRHRISLPVMFFCILSILLPTLSGTLSSIPRYLLVIIPLLAGAVEDHINQSFWVIFSIEYAMLSIALALFVQGIFVA